MPTCGECEHFECCRLPRCEESDECPARFYERKYGVDIEKMRKILSGDIRSPKEGKARQQFRVWLDRASNISADDLNLVLKDVKIDPSK